MLDAILDIIETVRLVASRELQQLVRAFQFDLHCPSTGDFKLHPLACVYPEDFTAYSKIPRWAITFGVPELGEAPVNRFVEKQVSKHACCSRCSSAYRGLRL